MTLSLCQVDKTDQQNTMKKWASLENFFNATSEELSKQSRVSPGDLWLLSLTESAGSSFYYESLSQKKKKVQCYEETKGDLNRRIGWEKG